MMRSVQSKISFLIPRDVCQQWFDDRKLAVLKIHHSSAELSSVGVNCIVILLSKDGTLVDICQHTVDGTVSIWGND